VPRGRTPRSEARPSVLFLSAPSPLPSPVPPTPPRSGSGSGSARLRLRLRPRCPRLSRRLPALAPLSPWSVLREAGLRGSDAAQAALTDDEARAVRGAAVAAGKARAIANAARRASWEPEDWEKVIKPALAKASLSQIMAAISLSLTTASGIRTGKRVAHPRNWGALAGLIASSPSEP
jgi:hypothetical protein